MSKWVTYAYEICLFTELRSRSKDYSTIVVEFDKLSLKMINAFLNEVINTMNPVFYDNKT